MTIDDNNSQPDNTGGQHSHTIDQFLLKKILDNAIKNRIEFKYQEAADKLDGIINLFNNLMISELPSNQIKILASAYCWKADILRLGSLDDQKLAITLLYKALAADPTNSEAPQLKRILEFELNFPV